MANVGDDYITSATVLGIVTAVLGPLVMRTLVFGLAGQNNIIMDMVQAFQGQAPGTGTGPTEARHQALATAAILPERSAAAPQQPAGPTRGGLQQQAWAIVERVLPTNWILGGPDPSYQCST